MNKTPNQTAALKQQVSALILEKRHKEEIDAFKAFLRASPVNRNPHAEYVDARRRFEAGDDRITPEIFSDIRQRFPKNNF